MVLLLFGGFLLNKDQVPGYVSWVANLSYFNYGYEVGLSATKMGVHTLWYYNAMSWFSAGASKRDEGS